MIAWQDLIAGSSSGMLNPASGHDGYEGPDLKTIQSACDAVAEAFTDYRYVGQFVAFGMCGPAWLEGMRKVRTARARILRDMST